MARFIRNPRILIVTPEVTSLPTGMGNMANYLTAKAGGLADVSGSLISALFDQGADVHMTMPDYRALFDERLPPVLKRHRRAIRHKMPNDRIHLAEDRAFFYLDSVYSGFGEDNIRISLAFQREVINNIIPRVQPNLIHCNDWMTGLIPAAARKAGIPCLFTIHNVHTIKCLLAQVEDRGIDAADFWNHLFFERPPFNYEDAREHIPVDFLASGVFAAHFVNTVSPSFLVEIAEGRHADIPPQLRFELAAKLQAGCGVGILNAPDPSFNPAKDRDLARQYNARTHTDGKRANKRYLQSHLGLIPDDGAPLFFWPSRLDPVQKGCQLLAEILAKMVHTFWDENLQVVFVANGAFKQHFWEIVEQHRFHDRVKICDFDERLSRLAYSAADFILMPSRFEPCGLSQMIGAIYGSLPVAFDTGGLHDTIMPLDVANDAGNGFLFQFHDAAGLFWAVEQAMAFYRLPVRVKQRQVERIMSESIGNFNYEVTAKRYIALYEKMLRRQLVA